MCASQRTAAAHKERYPDWSEPMFFRDACIPVRLSWSSPFARWQGPLAEVSSLDLAVQVTADALAGRGLPATEVGGIVLGWTVPQPAIFYGASTVAARIGAPHATGAMLSQACATSAACVEVAALRVDAGLDEVSMVIATDRTSNGPVLTYPAPSSPGGAPRQEHWILDSFRRDPWGGLSMIATAERVAAEAGLTREGIDEVALMRYQQYQAALADDQAFQRAYMVPVTVPSRRGEPVVIDGDVGVHPTTAEGLAKLAPSDAGGVVTYGTQTHPADGTAGMILATAARARELARGEGIARILGTGLARVGKGEMPKAPVPAAKAALEHAGLDFGDVDAVTTHNPFAVNDLWFSHQTGIPLERMNSYGCSLIYGHPQGPTGARLIVELLHTLRMRGGGIGLFTGCAAGDTGAAVVVRVED
jgi:acetyl-CoA acetyltransferase family protein